MWMNVWGTSGEICKFRLVLSKKKKRRKKYRSKCRSFMQIIVEFILNFSLYGTIATQCAHCTVIYMVLLAVSFHCVFKPFLVDEGFIDLVVYENESRLKSCKISPLAPYNNFGLIYFISISYLTAYEEYAPPFWTLHFVQFTIWINQVLSFFFFFLCFCSLLSWK